MTEAISRIQQFDFNTPLPESSIKTEPWKVRMISSNVRGIRFGSIPAYICEAEGLIVIQERTRLFQTTWQRDIVHQSKGWTPPVSIFTIKREKSNPLTSTEEFTFHHWQSILLKYLTHIMDI